MKLLFTLLGTLFLLQSDALHYSDGKHKITIEMADGRKNLVWGQRTILNLYTENIDLTRFSMSAPGLRFRSSDNRSQSVWEITPLRNYVKADTLKLFVSYNGARDTIRHAFKIRVVE